jgi:hypothetical protein
MSDMAAEMERHKSPGTLLAHSIGPALNRQEGGSHYKSMNIEPLAFCAANMTTEQIRAVTQQNVLKYTFRDKGCVIEDLKKARHYIDWAIENMEARNDA